MGWGGGCCCRCRRCLLLRDGSEAGAIVVVTVWRGRDAILLSCVDGFRFLEACCVWMDSCSFVQCVCVCVFVFFVVLLQTVLEACPEHLFFC